MSKESAYFRVENLKSKQDIKNIKKQLDDIKGVISVSINLDDSRLAVDYDNTAVMQSNIEDRLIRLGYEAKNDGQEVHTM